MILVTTTGSSSFATIPTPPRNSGISPPRKLMQLQFPHLLGIRAFHLLANWCNFNSLISLICVYFSYLRIDFFIDFGFSNGSSLSRPLSSSPYQNWAYQNWAWWNRSTSAIPQWVGGRDILGFGIAIWMIQLKETGSASEMMRM